MDGSRAATKLWAPDCPRKALHRFGNTNTSSWRTWRPVPRARVDDRVFGSAPAPLDFGPTPSFPVCFLACSSTSRTQATTNITRARMIQSLSISRPCNVRLRPFISRISKFKELKSAARDLRSCRFRVREKKKKQAITTWIHPPSHVLFFFSTINIHALFTIFLNNQYHIYS
jgi:hypothetical protein